MNGFRVQFGRRRAYRIESHILVVGIAVFCSANTSAQQYQVQQSQQYQPQQYPSQQQYQQPLQPHLQSHATNQGYGAPPFQQVQNGFVRPAANGYFQQQPQPAAISTMQLRADLNAAMRAGHWPRAIANVQALRLRESQALRIAHWLHVEAVLLTRQQSWQLAEVRLQEALKLSGSDLQRKYLLAEALSVVMMWQGRWADAASLLRGVEPGVASDIGDNSGLRHRWRLLRGLAGYQAGDYVEAAGLYGQLVQSDPHDAAATIGFARTLEQLKRYQVAMLSYRRVLRLTESAPMLRRYALERLRKITGAG